MSDHRWAWHKCSIQSQSCSLSGSWFENSEKTAHSSVKYQMCLSNALITALETTVLLCHVSYNHLNHATTAAVGHCRERHHQKMNSVTFPRTIGHCSGTETPVCQPRFSCSLPEHWKKTFLRGIKLASSIVHGALSRVTANAYLAQASLQKVEASALLPVLDTSLSASVWNWEKSFQRFY